MFSDSRLQCEANVPYTRLFVTKRFEAHVTFLIIRPNKARVFLEPEFRRHVYYENHLADALLAN